MAVIVLLSGWSGSGKDAVGSILKGYGFQTLAFADPLKKQISEEYKFPLRLAYTQEGKQTILQTGQTVREVLIQRAKEIQAETRPEIFAGIIAEQILKIQQGTLQPVKICITDWRLIWEKFELQERLPNAYIQTVRIKRKGQQKSPVNDQRTEHELDSYPFDITIDNDGISMEALKEEVQTKLGHLV